MIDDFAKEYLHSDLRDIREVMLWKLDGLSEYDIRRPLTSTGTNLLGMVKHLSLWESRYFGQVFDRPFPEPLPRWDDAGARGADMWATEHETREEIIDRYRRVWEHSDATIVALAIDSPGHVPWWPRPDVKLFNILVHVLTETSRHAGHADILREQLDGSTGTADYAKHQRDAAFWDARRAEIERAATAATALRDHIGPARDQPIADVAGVGVDSVAQWEARYVSAEQVWSGLPNTALVAEITGLTPGRALDVGCGEGADAVWLAGHGWDVTALDVSQVALERAARHARDAQVEVRWVHSALVGAPIQAGTFDLVSALYPALRRTPTNEAEGVLMGAVAPGGVLLVVHHADVDVERAKAHGFDPADYVSPADVAALLGQDWQVEFDERRPRDTTTGAGAHHTHDVVLRARRVQ